MSLAFEYKCGSLKTKNNLKKRLKSFKNIPPQKAIIVYEDGSYIEGTIIHVIPKSDADPYLVYKNKFSYTDVSD